MSETVKFIIEIPEKTVAHIRSDHGHGYKGMYDDDRDIIVDAIYNATPLDSNSERAEVQAYFDGQAYGWEEGRKALIDDLKAEILRGHIEADLMYVGRIIEILDNIGQESEVKPNETDN